MSAAGWLDDLNASYAEVARLKGEPAPHIVTAAEWDALARRALRDPDDSDLERRRDDLNYEAAQQAEHRDDTRWGRYP